MKAHRPLRASVTAAGLMVLIFLQLGITGRRGFDNPCEPDETNCVVLSTIAFSPVDGSWNINWAGPPRDDLRFSQAERYRITLELDRNAPRAFSRDFLIRENRWYGWDTLGRFTASFAAGSRTPTISYPSQCCGADAIPAGTPANLTDGTFWMGCTKAGRIKANGPHGDDGHASIRLEKVNKDDGIGVKNKFSQEHDINCR
jgi:hypothetical protein